jgi:cytochrome c peroxidase
MFHAAYPTKPPGRITIVEVGNAISHFEELAFAAAGSPWDHYVAGEDGAVSATAKMGALIFYGKGRCAACHSGALFSDFQYHGAGIFSKINVNGRYVDDLGRGAVTGKRADNYHFRTSPLRNVTQFGPYFHDGSTQSLYDALVRHIHPLAKAGTYNPDGSFAIEKDQADSVSPILARGIELNPTDIANLIAFLATLDSQSRTRAQIVPVKVPSGLAVSYK